MVLTGPLLAGGERIPNISSRTAADRIVIHHITLGIDTADAAPTGVGALGVEAGQSGRTVAVEYTLGSAAGWRTQVAWQAGADGSLLCDATLGVGAAWGRVTGVGQYRHRRFNHTS
jgi:hypothetical protein